MDTILRQKRRDIMKKVPFVTKEKLEEIIREVPTPFHIYDEAGIRRNCEAIHEAFAWNPG